MEDERERLSDLVYWNLSDQLDRVLQTTKPEVINRKNKENGETLLIYAVRVTREKCVRALLANGADQSIIDDIGWTPLMVAVHFGHLSILKLLYEHPTGGSAVARRKDKEGCTVFDIVKWYPWKPDVAAYLEQREREFQAIENVLPTEIAQLVDAYRLGEP